MLNFITIIVGLKMYAIVVMVAVLAAFADAKGVSLQNSLRLIELSPWASSVIEFFVVSVQKSS